MIELVEHPIDYAALVEAVRSSAAGAVCLFLGTTREVHLGREVGHLDYEAYGEMALKKLAEIESQMRSRWPVTECRIVHRTGRVDLGEISVAVVVSSPHRGDAFEACRHGIDALKAEAPIWKKETFADGESVWVDPTATGK